MAIPRMWVGRQVQIWTYARQFVGIARYKGSKYEDGVWIKYFELMTGKHKGHLITELEFCWNILKENE